MPNVFKIPDSLADKYHGCGIALASATGGQLINLVYLSDALPDFSGEQEDIPAALNDARLGPTVRLLQSSGEVFVGMCSCWEFVEL